MASVGAMIGSPARANMLAALFDGRAMTATELCQGANVSAATGSEHLAKLVQARLLVCERHGRHRYYRIAGAKVAEALEPLAHLAAARPVPMRTPSPEVRAMRHARLCYDHFAGKLGVAITTAMTDRGLLKASGRDFNLTAPGETFCSAIGIDLKAARARRRMFARKCLDWSERRPHLAGALGAAIAGKAFAEGWVERCARRREVAITPAGATAFENHFGFVLAQE